MRRYRHFLLSLVFTLLAALGFVSQASAQLIHTVAGGGPNNVPATAAGLQPYGAAVDSNGSTYVAAPNQNRIFKIDASGTLTVVAGTGTGGYNGDGIAATSAELDNPYGVAADSSGNVYIADYSNQRIRKVDPTSGLISTVAGTGTAGYNEDGITATSAELYFPYGVAVDGSGNIYIADEDNQRIRKVDATTGMISTVAGTGTAGYNEDGIAATSAELHYPLGVAVDSSGNVYIADISNQRVRKVDATTGLISTVAGTGTSGYNGDGITATSAELAAPRGAAVDGSGNIYIADEGNQRIRKVDATSGLISTVAGTGTSGYNGDGIAATSAELYNPSGVAVDGFGNIYIADIDNQRIRVVNEGATALVINGISVQSLDIATAGGNGSGPAFAGDGYAAAGAELYFPWGVTVDGSGNLYIADQDNQRIRVVNKQMTDITVAGVTIHSGDIATVAGTGTNGYNGDGIAATSAELYYPTGVAVDGSGNIYIADQFNQRVRKVDATTGLISTVAGTGTNGYNGDGIAATSAELYYPTGVAVDSSGNVYIADFSNQRVRKVDATTGLISTVAGTGTSGYNGDGITATSAELYFPWGVTVDGSGNIYIADQYNNRIRKVDATSGLISTVAGTGTSGYNGDGITATSAELYNPSGVAVDGSGNIYIADQYNQRIREVDGTSGLISTIGGNGTYGYNGDEIPATTAWLALPGGVAVDALGNVYFSDYENQRIRKIDPAQVNVTIASSPAGLSFSVTGTGCTPGTGFTTPMVLAWTPGSSCTVTFETPQTGTGGTQYVFSQWEDTTTNASRMITAPSSPATYTATFTGPQTITFTQAAPGTAAYGSMFTVAAQSTSGLTVALTVDAGSAGICALGTPSVASGVTSATVTMAGSAGTCTIDANQSGNGSYNAAMQVQTLATAVAPLSQTITFTTVAPASAGYGSMFPVAAQSSSGLAVTLSIDSNSTSICSLGTSSVASGVTTATVTMTSGTGACNIDANQAGNGSYSEAIPLQTSAAAQRIAQTISFMTTGPATAASGSMFLVVAQSTSALTVTLSVDSTSTSVCSVGTPSVISGVTTATVTMTGASGTCAIDANQAGNSNYLQAAQQTSVTVVSATVPNVVGDTQSAATTAINGAGLMVGTVTSQSSTMPSGDVISESPMAGTSVTPGSMVNLVLSIGAPPLVAVPNLLGQTQTAAATALSGAGLTVGIVTQQANRSVATGDIISEYPSAKTMVNEGTAVNLIVSAGPPNGEWTWLSGSNAVNQNGSYGTQGMAGSGSVPGARQSAVSWTDAAGNLWLFGGHGPDSTGNQGGLNDLWEYSGGQWTWVNGSNLAYQKGTYGTQGLAAPGNAPGAHENAIGWTDLSGNLWLFGGNGFGAQTGGYLNDLWEYSGGQWTWVSGSNAPYQSGTYGTQGKAAAGNVPGGRFGSVSWTDLSGNLWLFGGYGADSAGNLGTLNDLWEYSGGQWTWVSGSNVGRQSGTYGMEGQAAAGNVPGAREEGVGWTDASGNLWLFGGSGYDSAGNQGYLNDLWEYSGGQWTWMSGSNVANQGGTYGTEGIAAANNVPGARSFAVSWTDASGNFWLFGGTGYDPVYGHNDLNDLWEYSGGQWTWMSGSNVANQSGTYGTEGAAASTNVPGARGIAVSWRDASGNFWLFGGNGYDATGNQGFLNDLWEYEPLAQVPVPNVVGDTQQSATTAITGVGLSVGTVTTASSNAVPVGDVISESPAASTLVNVGSSVNLVLSSGPSQVAVPNVIGDMQAAATTAITGVGLSVETVTTASSNTVPVGDVISESPAASTLVNVGSSVNLVLSSGPSQVPVPNVAADTQSAATTAIDGVGLVVGTVTSQSSTTVTAGEVISESPTATTLVNVGSSVNLVLSSGPPNGEWTWVGGSKLSAQKGAYGTLGTPSVSNFPGARELAVTWTDQSGNFWLFGGYGYDSVGQQGSLNDLWEYSAGQWTWMSGSDLANQPGTYGTLGTPASTNVPGARNGAVGWTDASGNLWLFGGISSGRLNDLWKYSGGQWTWMGGSNVFNQEGSYGTQGLTAAGNVPGARNLSAVWTDVAGNFWLFGGYGYDSAGGQEEELNDLWEYSGGEWTWMGGSTVIDQKGAYGTQGVAAANNAPGARFAAATWIDAGGTLWLFGGFGYGSGDAQGDLNDFWKYSGGQWTWMGGSNVVNASGTYGNQGTAAPNNVPGARNAVVTWTDAIGNFWLFGGEGSDGLHNDLWKYSGGQWTWMGGSNGAGAGGTYGTQGIAAAGNVPGARFQAASWTDAAGNFWLLGGNGGAAGFFNDLWEYQPVTAPGNAAYFAVTVTSPQTAGTAFNFAVTALDSNSNTATGYTGTVHFTSSDGAAVLPIDTTLTNGAGTFSATLATAGMQTITATDTMTGSITGTSGSITVGAGMATSITPVPGTTPQSATTNTAFGKQLAVTVLDAYGNPVQGLVVTFTAPASGASGTFANNTNTTQASTGSNGVATATAFTANAVEGGPYNVVASASGPLSVNLVLTNIAATVGVPNVVGETQADATSAITGLGLVVGTVTSQSSTTTPAGDVISENPTATTIVNVGSMVNLVLSSGPPVAVPGEVGYAQSVATSGITAAGLSIGTITSQSSNTVPSGDVISESPVTGTLVAAGSPVSLVVSSGPSGTAAVFVGTDTNTQGSWQNSGGKIYGTDGYVIEGASPTQSLPSYVTQYSTQGGSFYTWAASTTDPRALLNANDIGRIAGTVFGSTFTFNITFTGGSHLFALYALDWDSTTRNETITIMDPNNGNQVLDTETVSNFHGGDYLVWNISGQVVVQVKLNSGSNAVISGVFFGVEETVNVTPQSTTLSAGQQQQFTATYTGTPSVTWSISNVSPMGAAPGQINPTTGAYTAPGSIAQTTTVTVQATSQDGTAAGSAMITLTASSAPVPVPSVVGDTQAAATSAITGVGLLVGTVTTAASSTVPSGDVINESPIAGTSVVAGSSVNLVVSTGPSQVMVPNVVNDTQAAATSAITGAGLLVGTVTTATSATVPSGDVISESPTAGTPVLGGSTVSLVVSTGSTSGGGTAAVFVGTDTNTQGSWQNPGGKIYGTDGYVIEGASPTQSLPSYVTQYSTQEGSFYTWAASTTDPRALLNANDVGRIAGTVFGSTFTFNITFTGGSHLFALYALDWDSTTRNETITIMDPNNGNQVLDTETVSSFHGGDYLVWNISGQVVVQVKLNSGSNAVISGVFFGIEETVNVTPQSTTLRAGQQQPFTATYTGTPSVTWSISNVSPMGAAPGQINPTTGAYTAPGSIAQTTTVTVQATSQDGTAAGSAMITLTASSAPVPVPSMVGDTQAAATSAITGVGLLVGTVTTAASSTVPSGDVINESPIAGTSVVAGSSVNLVVSTGPSQVMVPNVVNDTQAAATSAITGAGLLVGTVTTATSATVPSGDVISESPTAGTPVLGGTSVNLVLSTGVASAGPTVTFIKADTSTQGNWEGTYGTDGYDVINASTTVSNPLVPNPNIPSYATFSVNGGTPYTWAQNPTDPRALEDSTTGASGSRIAATWYSAASFSFSLNVSGTHQFALYAVDWEPDGRSETVTIVDPNNNNAVLDTENLTGSNFEHGQYLVWTISGQVKIIVTLNSGSSGNAVVSGVFFGGAIGAPAETVTVKPQQVTLGANQQQTFTAVVTGAATQTVVWSILNGGPGSIDPSSGIYTAPATFTNGTQVTIQAESADMTASGTATVTLSTTAGVSFIGTDSSTQGNWEGKYGNDGYDVVNAPGTISNPLVPNPKVPAYATFSVSDPNSPYTWTSTTSDPRALEDSTGGAGGSRIAAAWFNSPSFSFDVNFTDGNPHQFALYSLDWDSGGRVETVQIVDPSNNAVLDTETASSFSGGIYFVWNISGHVKIVVTANSGANAVISGAFFGPVDTTPPRTQITSVDPNLSPTNSTTITFNFIANESSTFTCSLDSSNAEPCTSPYTYNGLADGTHSFLVVATNTAGNADPTGASYSWTVDTSPLAISNLNVSSITTSTAVVTWTTNLPSSTQVFYELYPSTTYSSTTLDNTLVTSHSTTLTGLMENGFYMLYGESIGAGQQDQSSGVNFRTAK